MLEALSTVRVRFKDTLNSAKKKASLHCRNQHNVRRTSLCFPCSSRQQSTTRRHLRSLSYWTIIELAVLFSTESSPTTIALRLELLFPQLFRYLRCRTGDPLAIR